MYALKVCWLEKVHIDVLSWELTLPPCQVQILHSPEYVPLHHGYDIFDWISCLLIQPIWLDIWVVPCLLVQWKRPMPCRQRGPYGTPAAFTPAAREAGEKCVFYRFYAPLMLARSYWRINAILARHSNDIGVHVINQSLLDVYRCKYRNHRMKTSKSRSK